MGIVGKFFLHLGATYSHTGEVMDQISPDLILLRVDTCGLPGGAMIAVSLSSIVTKFAADGSLDAEWEFFESREDLQAFETFAESFPDDRPSQTVN